MNKKKSAIIFAILFLISVCIILMINKSKLSEENNLLKDRQGEVIQENVLRIFTVATIAEEDLKAGNTSIYGYYFRFQDFAMFDLPKGALQSFLQKISGEFDELNKLIDSNASQKDIDEMKQLLEQHLAKLETALKQIMDDCVANNINYYLLDSNGNKTMEKVLKILLEAYNVPDKK